MYGFAGGNGDKQYKLVILGNWQILFFKFVVNLFFTVKRLNAYIFVREGIQNEHLELQGQNFDLSGFAEISNIYVCNCPIAEYDKNARYGLQNFFLQKIHK